MRIRQMAFPSTAKTVYKALQVLDCFLAARRSVGITEIARHTGINTSTVQRIVNTYCQHGYLQQEVAGSAYRLGIKFLEVSGLILQQMDLRAAARPLLQELRDKTGETAHLMVLEGHMGIYVDAVESPRGTRVVSAIGSRDDLHSSAVGKAILAHLSEHQLDARLRTNLLRRKTPRTITDPRAFRRHLETVRKRGYSVDDEEGELGTRCVGAPIFNHAGAVAGSISVAAPAQRMSRRKLSEIAPLVMETAARISERLGQPTVSAKTGGLHGQATAHPV